ncbi:MAG: GAF domain-containing protein [Chloroflexi bacterium]|nr:GAF domain-containing protein [Chloroflexota bacterium]
MARYQPYGSPALPFSRRRYARVRGRQARGSLAIMQAERLHLLGQEAIGSIAAILVRPGSFQDRLETALEEVVRVLQADRVVFRVVDEETGDLNLVAGAGPAMSIVPPLPVIQRGEYVLGQAAEQGMPVIVNSMESHPNVLPSLVEHGMRSSALMPVKANDRVLGVLATNSRLPGHFTPDRVHLLTAIANGMGPFLDNARLRQDLTDELEQSRQRLASLQAVASSLLVEQDVRRALRNVAASARKIARASSSAVYVWDSTQRQGMFASEGPMNASMLRRESSIGEWLCSAMEEGRVLRAVDLEHPFRSRGLASDHPMLKNFVGTPIVLKGAVGGAIYVWGRDEKGDFSAQDEQRLHLLALLIGRYLENAELYREVEMERKSLAAMQESMVEGLVVVTREGRVRYLNGAAKSILGLETRGGERESVRENILLQMPKITNPLALEPVLRVISGERDAPVSVEIALKQMERQDLLVTAFPIHIADSERITGILLRDITKERDLEERRDSFVSIASHELRTPMTTILGFSELLLQRDPPRETRQEWLGNIHRSSKRLIRIVEDLLDVSRIQTGKLSVELAQVSLRDVVDDVATYIRTTTDKHSLTLEVDEALPLVTADREKLGQVLTNLLENAVKYSPRGGRIRVGATYSPALGCVVVSVADEGIGIAPEDIGGLFSSFNRIRSKETEGIGGTGLGLFIVKQIVELMHGQVWVESRLGQGSTFSFSLPTTLAKGGETTVSQQLLP